jgi:hypothetical protein
MRRKNYAMMLLLILGWSACFCQDSDNGNYTIGILPVTTTDRSAYDYTMNVQNSISSVFSSKSRFTVVDRSKFEQIARERNLQKQEEFINSSTIVEQGKSLGAQYLVSGNINQIGKAGGYKEKSKLVYDQYTKKLVAQKYNVYITEITLTVNVQVIDVATAAVKSTKSFSTVLQTETSSEATAMENAIKSLEMYYKAWINEHFPVYMKVIRIEKSGKKGLPEKILIKGGVDMDLSESNKWVILNTSSELEVFEFESLVVDGKEYKRPVTIGRVKIDEVQGEFSICKVKNGAENIQKKLEEGKTLLLKIAQY